MKGHTASISIGKPAHPPMNCTICGCAIQWRRWRAANWQNVKYCSASCRRAAVLQARTAGEAHPQGCAQQLSEAA